MVDAAHDPLTTISAWQQKCRRYGRARNGTTIDVLEIAINEISQLRKRLEACRARRRAGLPDVVGRRVVGSQIDG